ncbi:hypothetical protein [Lacticaseibacillus absianus]|uniref:hypothetical protein n=1 Tax=Lacticaseibacillus absianus TaxID=2729623 RepID=UPI0015CA9504|nr:hypothetical protein [Lacticaseibacillus absianus]
MASDEEKLRRVRRLRKIFDRLATQQAAVDALSFTRFKSAGSGQWRGQVKAKQFDPEYAEAVHQLVLANQAVADAMQAVSRQMYATVWSIGDLAIKAQALAASTF